MRGCAQIGGLALPLVWAEMQSDVSSLAQLRTTCWQKTSDKPINMCSLRMQPVSCELAHLFCQDIVAPSITFPKSGPPLNDLPKCQSYRSRIENVCSWLLVYLLHSPSFLLHYEKTLELHCFLEMKNTGEKDHLIPS